METQKLKPGSYPSHFAGYIELVKNKNLDSILKNQIETSKQFFNSIPEEKTDYRYAEGKWNIKEVLQHIIDTERIFTYRALAFARKEISALPNMDENNYAENSHANNRKWKDLIEEFEAVRHATIYLYESFSEDQLELTGKTVSYEMSVKAVGYIIAGHSAHHINILKERYLTD
jgi:uncharacterized damage-inducible protein DinB